MVPTISAARRQDTTWWTGRSRSSRWIPEPSLISDPSDMLGVDFVRILCLSWFKVYPRHWWGSLMIISSDKSFISEVSLATSLGWHSPPTQLPAFSLLPVGNTMPRKQLARPKAQSYLGKSKDIWSWNAALSWKNIVLFQRTYFLLRR